MFKAIMFHLIKSALMKQVLGLYKSLKTTVYDERVDTGIQFSKGAMVL